MGNLRRRSTAVLLCAATNFLFIFPPLCLASFLNVFFESAKFHHISQNTVQPGGVKTWVIQLGQRGRIETKR